MHLAALVTTGGLLPDGTKVHRGNVLYVTAEDDAADTVRPRMEGMGADLKRVRVLDDFLVFSDEGHEALREEMERFRPELVVIDTLYSFLPEKVDLGKPTSIRAELHRLDRLFKEFGPAVILIRHWTKGGKGSKAIYRGVGAIDIIGVVRTGLAVAQHPENDKLRILAQVKNNIGPKAPSMVFELVAQEGLPRVVWHGTTHYTADDLERHGGENEGEEDRAIKFLQKELAKGPLPSTELSVRAARANISRPTLNRAKDKAGAESVKMGKGWVWRLREK